MRPRRASRVTSGGLPDNASVATPMPAMNLNRPLLLIAVLCVLLFGALVMAWQHQDARPPAPPPVVAVTGATPASAAAAPSVSSGASASAVAAVKAPAASAAEARAAAPSRAFDPTLGGALTLDAQTRSDLEALLAALPPDAGREELNRVRGELRAHLPPDDADKAELLMLAYRLHVSGLLRDELGPDAPAVPPAGR